MSSQPIGYERWGSQADQAGAHRAVAVLTVDDQAVARAAVREVVVATPGFEPLAEAGSGEEGLILADRLHPDLVLLDVSMPGMDGIETTRRLVRAHRDLTVVLISAYGDPTFERAPESCGAAAAVRKQDLRPGTLRALWARHGHPRPA